MVAESGSAREVSFVLISKAKRRTQEASISQSSMETFGGEWSSTNLLAMRGGWLLLDRPKRVEG